MRSAQTDSVFRVLHAMTLRERRESRHRHETAQARVGPRLAQALLLTEITLLVISVAIAAAVHVGLLSRVNLVWHLTSLGAISLAQVAVLVHPLMEVHAHRRTLTQSWLNPVGSLLGNARTLAQVDRRYVEKLLRSPMEVLELVWMEVRAERDAHLKRTAVIMGPVDKLGLVPGLLATALAVSNFSTTHSAWVDILRFIGPAWFLLGACTAMWTVPTLNRQVCVLEWVLAQSKANVKADTIPPHGAAACVH